MPNKTEEQLKLLNEILSIITFYRRDDGSFYIAHVRGHVGLVDGDVREVKGDVWGVVKGNVRWVEGEVHEVEGDVEYLHGEVKNYVKE